MRFRIDLKIFIFLIVFYFTKQIEIYSIIMIFAFIHELGHLLAGIILKMRPEKLEIMPFGVSISFKLKLNDYNKKIKKANLLEVKKIVIAIAGPMTNLIIAIISYVINLNIIITYANILIMIFNLLPIYPLDGGRILKGSLHIIFGKKEAEKYIGKISIITIIILTALSSIIILKIHNVAILIALAYLWGIVIKENIRFRKKEVIYKKIEEISDKIVNKTIENKID